MQYDSYSYLWPPRPEKPVPEGLIAFYEQRGWWALWELESYLLQQRLYDTAVDDMAANRKEKERQQNS